MTSVGEQVGKGQSMQTCQDQIKDVLNKGKVKSAFSRAPVTEMMYDMRRKIFVRIVESGRLWFLFAACFLVRGITRY